MGANGVRPILVFQNVVLAQLSAQWDCNHCVKHHMKLNQYQCDVCNSLRDATKTLQIVEAPNVLILVLLRFKYDAESQSRKKLTTLVNYPDTLVVGEENYSLKNVVVHSGCDSGEGDY